MTQFSELDDVAKDRLVSTGISFLRAITEYYGPDDGMTAWETLSASFDPELKGQIFFSLMTGQFVGKITINYSPVGTWANNIVSVIKAIRSVDKRGLGLKEAKDLADLLRAGQTIELEVEPAKRESALRELRLAGIPV